jgi:3-oxoacyl-[acyl-carrier protein] reductase
MVRRVGESLPPVDVLVANAGGNPVLPGPVEEISLDDWQAAVAANLNVTFATIKAFLPEMKRRKSGSIVTISSAAARRPTAQTPAPYAASKAGIQVLTQIVAAQVGPFGIRVNCIAPETILTERNLERIPEVQREKLVAMHPIPRLGTPEDVADAAVFLASDESAWITGAILDVAGGAVMR